MKTYTKLQSLVPNKYGELETLLVKYLRRRAPLLQSQNAKQLAELRAAFLSDRCKVELEIRALQRSSNNGN